MKSDNPGKTPIRNLAPILLSLFPLIVYLLQLTIAERSAIVYATFAIPAIAWISYSLLIGAIFAFKKRWSRVALNIVSLLTAVFGIGAYSLGSPSDEPADLRVMTFNVQLFRDYPMEEVAKAINSENPDIVCLQELPKDGRAQEFANLFEGYEYVHDRRLGILSKHPIKRVHNWNVGTRGRYVLGVEITIADNALLIIDAHLQHFPADNLSAVSTAARTKFEETGAVESLIEKLEGTPLIFAGDLNTPPQGSVNRMLRRHLTDSFATTSRGFGSTIPSTFPLRRIDYIYTGNGITPLRTRVSGAGVSDHRAVVADLSIQSKADKAGAP